MATTWVPTPTFGSRLAMVRRHLGWNQKEAALRSGLDKASWSNWERGISTPQRMNEVVDKIAAATGADRDWLMWGTPSEGAILTDERSGSSVQQSLAGLAA